MNCLDRLGFTGMSFLNAFFGLILAGAGSNLPLPKGGIIPSLEKRGRGDFLINVNSIMRRLISTSKLADD